MESPSGAALGSHSELGEIVGQFFSGYESCVM